MTTPRQKQPGSLPMSAFVAASLAPVVLLVLGALAGPGWLIAALVYLTAFAALLDRLLPRLTGNGDEAEFPAADVLLIALGLAHLALMPLAVWLVGGPSGLSAGQRIIAFLAFGLHFGQISNPAAHELIHRGSRAMQALGTAVYITLMFGHHASAHRLVHHRHVATPDDPNTARRGESFYRFAPRAWIGSFRAGWRAERRTAGRLHPYATYLGGAAACLGLSVALAGPAGLAAYVALALYATAQLLLSDYVQHYGLTRALRADGRPEPVGHRHSWNAPQRFTAAMLLNAPRHSDYHAHPARPYPALRLPPDAPILPRSLPMMANIALVPPLWRRMMHPRLDRLAARSRQSDGPASGGAPSDLAV
jgi:alkane 1-monooxygenase